MHQRSIDQHSSDGETTPGYGGRDCSGWAENIYRTLYGAIVSRALPPGTKLTERIIAKSFGVSRTVIRPVLRRLEHEGVVEIFPNRGAFVARPNVEETHYVFQARRIIESGIVAQLGQIDPAAMETLGLWIEAEDGARAANDEKELFRVSGDFHLALAELAGNPILLNILRDLVVRSVLATALYQRSIGSGCRTDHHRRLLKLLKNGQTAKAARFMIEHLTTTERDLDFSPKVDRAADLNKTLADLVRGRPEQDS